MRNDPTVHADLPWTSIDREAVLTYSDRQSQSSIAAAGHLESANAAIAQLARREGWSQPSIRPDGNELDQIAISNDGLALVLIELKPRNGAKAFYSPLQLAGYALEWALALAGPDRAMLVSDLNALADAKSQAGLVRNVVNLREPLVIRLIIGFNEPPTTEVARRMPVVWDAISSHVEHPSLLRPEVWAWPDHGLSHKIFGL